ncbi:MAG: galactokinase [Planctomycetota bacterium]
MTIDTLRKTFADTFGRDCSAIARAPGRVNLIGEHTDYNDGLVLPIAVGQATFAVCARRDDARARVVSLTVNDHQEWAIDGWKRGEHPHWTSYVAGVAALLRRRGARLEGFDLLIASDVPTGGGLSSSAALEVSTLLALCHLSGEPLMSNEFIDLCRAAEHEFAGVPCGLMDPSASLLGKAGAALLLDCRSRAVEHVPLALDGLELLVIDSGVKHELASGEYAKRQMECAEAVAYLKARNPSVRALRDVSSATLRAHAQQMPPLAAARALHVTTENERVAAAVKAVRAGRYEEFGELLRASHRSLRDDYEVSCRELDRIVRSLDAVDGVLGSRMTGGGFGGCVIALLRESAAAAAIEAVRADYFTPRGAEAKVLRVSPSAGASLVYAK